MIYVLIDTSVLIKTYTHSCQGCEISDLVAIVELVDSGTVQLLFPEVIGLEIQKSWRSFSWALKQCVSGVSSKIDNVLKQQGAVWNEAESIRPAIASYCDTWAATFEKECGQRHEQLQKLLSSDKFTHLPFTMETMFRAKRLMISGAMDGANRSDQDAFIVQSVIEYLEEKRHPGDFLYISTQNTKDFAVQVGAEPALRIGIREQLPDTSFFKDMRSLCDAAKKHVQPVAPSPEEVQEAEDRESVRCNDVVLGSGPVSRISSGQFIEQQIPNDPAFMEQVRLNESVRREFIERLQAEKAALGRFADPVFREQVRLNESVRREFIERLQAEKATLGRFADPAFMEQVWLTDSVRRQFIERLQAEKATLGRFADPAFMEQVRLTDSVRRQFIEQLQAEKAALDRFTNPAFTKQPTADEPGL